MGDIVTLHQIRGLERAWVPKAEESWWIAFWGRSGVPAARLVDYRRWGGFWPRATESADRVMLPRTRRRRTDYARWQGYP